MGIPHPPSGIHALAHTPDRLDEAPEGFRNPDVSWVQECSCGWESAPTQYAETAQSLGTAHLIEVGVKRDTYEPLRMENGRASL